MEGTPKYCVSDSGRSDSEQVFTQPQRQAYRAQHFWLEPANFDCQGTDQFMPFALFTTLLRRVRLSQGNQWLFGKLILSFLLEIAANIVNARKLILGILNPIKLTWSVHVSHTKFKIMVWVL